MARRSRPQTSNWEEARGEFYQEHFPSSQAGLETDDGLSGGVSSSSQAQLLNILPSRQLLHTVDGMWGSRGAGEFQRGDVVTLTGGDESSLSCWTFLGDGVLWLCVCVCGVAAGSFIILIVFSGYCVVFTTLLLDFVINILASIDGKFLAVRVQL